MKKLWILIFVLSICFTPCAFSLTSVDSKTLAIALKKKTVQELRLGEKDAATAFLGIYNSQYPDELKQVEGTILGERHGLAIYSYKKRNFALGREYVGHYAIPGSKDKRLRVVLYRNVAAFEMPNLNDGQTVSVNDCTLAGEEVVAISIPLMKKDVKWKPEKAWRFDTVSSEFKMIDPQKAVCEAW